MKKSIAALAAIVLAAGTTFAGDKMVTPVETYVEPTPLFGPGLHLGAHALYLTPDSDIDETWGGGLNLDYFFTSYIGLQASASWADPGTDEVWHNYVLDLVLRLPIEAAHIAPYVFAGGGAIVEDDANILGRAGAGLEFRPVSNFGIFGDWSYAFPGGGGGDDDIEDYQMIRMGVKFGF